MAEYLFVHFYCEQSNAGPQFGILLNKIPVATGEITRSRYVRVDVEIIRPMIPHCRFDDDVINERILSQIKTDEMDNIWHDEPVSSGHIVESLK